MSQSIPSNGTNDLIGTMIAGRYRIISKLGEGGMGVTFRAWDSRDGVPVVIKMPRVEIRANKEFMARFGREVQTMLGLSHEHIAPITDHGEEAGCPFVVMRFLPGGSLSNRRLRDASRKPKPMLPVTLHAWLPQIAAALDFVHSQGVVHRDVKPANIFFDASWGAFLGDFGIAKIVESTEAFDKENTLTATHMGIGTQEYMPPEQYTPKAKIDGRADQYALGVMVYEMLAGVRPFTGETAHLIVEVTSRPVPPLQAKRNDLPAALVNAVHKALAKNPNERFGSCREFAEAVLRDVPVPEEEQGVARLLCPKCSKILKLPRTQAGKKGKCPNCNSDLIIAQDLGALWLLDEDPTQRPSVNAEGGIEVDSEALEEFKPISDTTPKRKITRGVGRKVPTGVMWGGLAALALAALVGSTFLLSGAPKDGKQKRESGVDMTLAEAEQTLKVNPEDPKANELLGKYWCFSKQDWPKGLPHLAKGMTAELAALAQQEIAAENTEPVDAGNLIALARKWWELAKQNGQNAEPSSSAIQKHAADMYVQHVGALVTPADITSVNAWLDTDQEFRELVWNTRPQLGEQASLHGSDTGQPGASEEKNEPSSEVVFLAELQERDVSVGHGLFGKNGSLGYDGHLIVVKGIRSQKGISMHPPHGGVSRVAYSVPEMCTGFRATAGLNDSGGVQVTPLVFRVFGDDRLLWQSQPLLGAGKSEECRIPINRGTRTLMLTVDCPGDCAWAHAVWVDPHFELHRGPTARAPSDAVVSPETGHAYKAFKEVLSWDAAKDRCEQMGGHLVTISSADEQALVMKCIKRSGIQVDRRDGQPTAWDDKLWVGGTDQGTDGKWRWIDGSEWTFSAWVLNQPDGDGDFLNICPHIAGEWNDEANNGDSRIAGFICEWGPLDRVAGDSNNNRNSDGFTPTTITNSIGMPLRLISAGTFQMGSDQGRPEEKPVHEVRISKAFYVGVNEVTNAQWERVMGSVPSRKKDTDHPVENVRWRDATEFCNRLSALPEEKKAGRVYRLPTEAEWEYACRAGTKTAFSFGDSESQLGDYGWFKENSGGQTHPVGKRKPNPWGLFDMHGNVWEWCSDSYVEYGSGAVTDPQGPAEGSSRIPFRGGCWYDPAQNCRSARRVDGGPSVRGGLGLRVAMSVPPSNQPAQQSVSQGADKAVHPEPGVDLDFVPVGDAGNPADANGFGKVDYDYWIGRYEVTIEQYCEFLNRVARTDPHGLYSKKMRADGSVLAIERLGAEGTYKYRVIDKAPAGHVNAHAHLKPKRAITCVSWTAAARFCNWLHNGQGDGDTETGAYALNGVQDRRVPREKDARFFLPTEDEWYKAAYFDADLAESGSRYWKFGTRSNDSPLIWKSLREARWNPKSLEVPNIANWGWGGGTWDTLAAVDLFPNATSAYGCQCMSGNAAEWVEPKGDVALQEGVTRGGFWWDGAEKPDSKYRKVLPVDTSSIDVGFRVAARQDSGGTQTSVIPGKGGKQFQDGKLRVVWGTRYGEWIDLTVISSTLQTSGIPGRSHIEYQNGRLREVFGEKAGEWITIRQ